MGNLELNADHDEVTASGALGYILLYLDDKPSMRWRFNKTMKIKLGWEKTGCASGVGTSKTISFSEYKKFVQLSQLPNCIADNFNRDSVSVASSSCQDSLETVSNPIQFWSEASKQGHAGSSSTLWADIGDDFGVTSDNDSMDLSVAWDDLNSSSALSRFCGASTLTSEGEDHQLIPACSFKCHECQGDFVNQGDLFLHQVYMHGFDFVVSHYPQFDFTKNCDLESNILSNKCPICLEAFLETSALKEHIGAAHFQESAFKCCVSGEIQQSKDTFKGHLQNVHDLEGENERDKSSVLMDSEWLGPSVQDKLKETDSTFERNVATKKSLKRERRAVRLDEEKSKMMEPYKLVNRKEDNENVKNSLSEEKPAGPPSKRGLKQKFCKLCNQQYLFKSKHFEEPSKNLKCPTCGHVCDSQAHLTVHENILCKYNSTEAEQTHRPTKKVKLTQIFPCPACGIKFMLNKLVGHIKRCHTKERVYSCCVCKKGLSNTNLLNEHIKTHLGIESQRGKWRCSQCPAVYSNASEFHRHANIHKSVCVFCKKDFSFEQILKQHYRDEHEDLLLSCRTCGYRVATKKQLWTHERHHKYSKPLPCHICGKIFKRMEWHLARCKRNVGDDVKLRDINDSTSSALSISALNKNGKGAANVHKFLCSMCPQTFPSEGFLVRHMATVHKQKTGLKCPQCPKRFATRDTLKSHIRGHLNKMAQRFVCSVCGKTFEDNYHLKFHMRVHAPVKEFHCTICGVGFNYKVTFNTHMKTKHGTLI